MRPYRSRLRPPGRVLLVGALALTVTACGVATDVGSEPGEATTDTRSVPAASSTTSATAPKRDPRSITGPSTAVIADDDVHPITDSPSPQLPVTVTSYDGAEVTVESVERIVAVDMNGTLTEIVFTLGLGPNMVGRDMSADFALAADVPVVTVGGHNLSAEGILELDPTVILTDSDIGPAEVQQQLRDAGIPVVFFDPERSLETIPTLISSVAETLGVPDVGDQLIDRVDEQVAAALELAPKEHDPLRITFLYVRGQAGVYLMAGDGSGADSMIEAIGGIDVGTELGLADSFVPITSEALIAAQPDVIVVMTRGLESVGGVDGLLEIPGVAQTPAGQNRRVVDMEDSIILAFGPRTGGTIEALARAVYDPAS